MEEEEDEAEECRRSHYKGAATGPLSKVTNTINSSSSSSPPGPLFSYCHYRYYR